MRKFFYTLSVLVCLLGVSGNAWAGDTHYYAQLKTKVAANSTAGGKVYAGTSNSAPNASSYGTDVSSDTQDSKNSSGGAKTFYAFAQANEGYSFTGWYSGDNGTGDFLGNESPLTVVVNASTSGGGTNTRTIYATFAENKAVDVTFIPGTNGSYTVNGTKITASQSVTCEGTTSLVATASSGYKFFGWYTSDDGGTTRSYFSYSATASQTFLSATTVYADFIPSTTAVFIRNANDAVRYKSLTEALSGFTSGVISVCQNGTVESGNYTIPKNVTLLVPYDAAYTNLTKPTDVQTWANLSEFRRLSLAAGANIIVNGSLCVAGRQWGTSSNNPGPGSVLGAYGVLDMSAGGHVSIEDKGVLHAYGFIIGKGDQSQSGTITIKNGGVVYEDIAINDLHGGGGTAACINGTKAKNDYELFVFNQYFVQNVEPKMTIEYGGSEIVYYDIQSSQGGDQGTANLIGKETSFLFQLSSGASITKWYDVTRDYQCYEVRGSLSMNGISIDAVVTTLSSTKFVLPFNNNMEITAKSGSTLNLPYSIKFQAGAGVIIEEGATVNVSKDLYFYDYQDWDKFGCGYAQTFGTSTSGKKLSWHTLRDVSAPSKLGHAKLVVNGTLNVNSGGALYTTSHGGSITSEGAGKIVFNAAAKTSNKNLYEIWGTYGKRNDGAGLEQGQTNAAEGQVRVGSYSLGKTWYIYGTPVECTPAQLLNSTAIKETYGDDFTYLATSGTAASTTINYKNGHWGWVGIWKNGDEVLKTVNVCTENLLVVDSAPALPQPYSDEDYEYICEDWTSVKNGDKQEIVYTPNFRALPIIKFMMGTNHKLVHKQAYDYDSIPSYKAPNCYGENNKYIYEFIGWSETKNGDTLASLPKVTEPATYYAQYREIPNLEVGNTQTSEEQQETQPGEQQSNPEPEERTVNVSLIVDSTTVGDNGSLIVTTKNDNPVTLETEVITVQDGGSVTIEGDASIKTGEFVLEATLGVEEKDNGENIVLIPNNTSGQVNGGDNIKGRPAEPTAEPTEPNVYFKLAHKGGFKKRTWYAIAVPWTIKVPSHEEGGITIYKNGKYKPQKLSIDFDVLRYDGAMRAEKGNVSDCWTYIDDVEGYDDMMKPGVFYMIYLTEDADAIRFEKKAGTDFHFGNEVVTTPAPTNRSAGDANWNGVANPNTYNATVNSTDVSVGQCYVVDSEGQGSYHTITFANEQLSVGVPVFVQTEATSIMVNKPSSTPASAPRRLLEAEQKHDGLVEVQIAPKGLHYSDRVFLQTEDGKEDIYSIGQDVVKAGTSRRMAQMWIDRYDSKLCMNTVSAVDNTATYPLGISIPNAGTFTISVPADKLNGDEVYLTKNGRILWDLSAGEYTATFEKGTTTEYGLLLVRNKAPEATQGVDEINAGADGQGAMKVLLNNQVYIIRGGEMYTITGSKVQ